MCGSGTCGRGCSRVRSAARSTRLARPFLDVVPIDKLGATMKPVFEHFRAERNPNEAFGDYCDRVGFDYLKTFTSVQK